MIRKTNINDKELSEFNAAKLGYNKLLGTADFFRYKFGSL